MNTSINTFINGKQSPDEKRPSGRPTVSGAMLLTTPDDESEARLTPVALSADDPVMQIQAERTTLNALLGVPDRQLRIPA